MDIGADDDANAGLVLRLGYSEKTGDQIGHWRRQPYTYRKSEASESNRMAPGPSLTLGLLDALDCPSVDDEQAAERQNSSPSSVVSASFSNMKMVAEAGGSEEAEKLSSRGCDEEDEDVGARKKLRLTKEQSALLEDRFNEHSTLNPKQKAALAKQLNLRPRQVEVWFQNRRARTKLKQTEVDCEFLRRCCETLTDENRRLHQELQDLKTLKLSKAVPLYMQQLSAVPTALTVCPSCQKVVGGSDDTAKATGALAADTVKKTLFLTPFTRSAAC